MFQVDGVLENSATVTSGTFSGMNQPFYLGRNMYGGYFQGNLREMSVWNYEKTGTQINSDMGTTFTGSETGMVGYWPMTSSGTSGNDVSTANHDATMTNGPVPATDPDPVIFLADIRQSMDYSPFGVKLHNRDLPLTVSYGTLKPYRYGFQNQEEDDEFKGDGNSVNFEHRMHDPRLGRFFAIDHLAERYPYYSPYSFSGNRVIDSKELEGLEPTQSITNKGTGNIIITIGAGDNDIVNKAGMATANDEGSTFDHIHGNTIQDVEAQIQSYMATYKLESLKTIIWHQHGGEGYLGVPALKYPYDCKDLNNPIPGSRGSSDITPGEGGSLQTNANKEFTGSNPQSFSAVKSFVNIMNKIGKDGNIVFASCATAAKHEGHYSFYLGQFAETVGKLIGYKANVYANVYLTNAMAIGGVVQSLLNFPLSYGFPINPKQEIGWYVQKSISEGKGLVKIETNSIQVTSEGKVEYVNSERIQVPEKPHD